MRCSKCTQYVKNHKRKLDEWQVSQGDCQQTILSPGGKIARAKLWQKGDDVVMEVREVYHTLQGLQEQHTQLARIARHLALEPELLQQINPISVTDTVAISFCPSHLDVDTKKCKLYEIKKKQSNNNLHCELCMKRMRYKRVKEEEVTTSDAYDTTTHTADTTNAGLSAIAATNTNTNSINTHFSITASTNANSKVNIGLLSRDELLKRCHNSAADVKQLHRALVRAHVQKQHQAITGVVVNNESMLWYEYACLFGAFVCSCFLMKQTIYSYAYMHSIAVATCDLIKHPTPISFLYEQ